MKRPRADACVVASGLAHDLIEARALILAGEVWQKDRRVAKPGQLLDASVPLERRPTRGPFASRAGQKLDAALEAFGIDVRGRRALDVGASHGGFTDCLLRRGATHVVALDVGKRLIDARLRADPRVTVVEGKNVRHLRPGEIAGRFDLVTVDISFISATAALPALVPYLAPGADLLVLVKPQFEAPRGSAPDGVVRDTAIERAAVARVAEAARALGLSVRGQVPAAMRGAHGNQEHVLWLA